MKLSSVLIGLVTWKAITSGRWLQLNMSCLQLIIALTAVEDGPLEVDGYVYPDWANGIGWCIVAFTSMWVPIVAVYQVMIDGGWQVSILTRHSDRKVVDRTRPKWHKYVG